MGLITFSIILSVLLGSCLWLVMGNQFPITGEDKWQPLNNICCYAALLALPIYLIVFFIY